MELNTFFRVLARRYYLVVLALLIAGGLANFAVQQVGPTYHAEGSVLLLPPATTIQDNADNDTQGNPYLLLGGLTQARDIVIRDLTSKSTADEFGRRHPGATYKALPDPTGALVALEVEADSATGAVDGLSDLIAEVPTTLVDLQSSLDLKASAYITSMQVTADSRPDVSRKAQIRTLVAVGGAVTVALLLLIGLLDGLLLARRERSSREQAAGIEAALPPVSASDGPAPADAGQGAPAQTRPSSPGGEAPTRSGRRPRPRRPTEPSNRGGPRKAKPGRPAARTPPTPGSERHEG